MNKIFPYIILLSMFFISCGGLPAKKNFFSYDIAEANELIESGDLLVSKHQLEPGLYNYLNAYKKFTLIDYRNGKFTASIKIARVYIKLGDLDNAYQWILNSEENFDGDIAYSDEFILPRAEYFLNIQNYEEILKISSPEKIIVYDLITQMELSAYRVFSLLQLSKDYSSEVSFLKNNIKIIEEKGNLHEIKNPLAISFTYYALGYVSSREGEWNSAYNSFNKSLEIDKIYSNYTGIADNLYAIGIVEKNMNNFEEAKKNLSSAIEIYTFLNDDFNKELTVTELLILQYLQGKEKEGTQNKLIEIYSNSTNEELRTKIRLLLKLNE